eukprot:920092-Amorphochlora_amoeboformis.AAC.1
MAISQTFKPRFPSSNIGLLTQSRTNTVIQPPTHIATSHLPPLLRKHPVSPGMWEPESQIYPTSNGRKSFYRDSPDRR